MVIIKHKIFVRKFGEVQINSKPSIITMFEHVIIATFVDEFMRRHDFLEENKTPNSHLQVIVTLALYLYIIRQNPAHRGNKT